MEFLKFTFLFLAIVMIANAGKGGNKGRPKTKPGKKGGLKVRLRALEAMVQTDITALKNQMASCNCGQFQGNMSSGGAMGSSSSSSAGIAALNASVQDMYTDLDGRITAVTQDVQRYGVMLFNLVEMQAGMEDRLLGQLNSTIQEIQMQMMRFSSDISQAVMALSQSRT